MFFAHAGHGLFKCADNQRECLDQADYTAGCDCSGSDVFDIVCPQSGRPLLGICKDRRDCFCTGINGCVSAEQSDSRHKDEPAQSASGQHVAGDFRPADESDTCQGRHYLDTDLGTGITFECVSDFTGEQLQSVCNKLIKCGNTQTGEYGAGFAAAFFSCQKNFRTGSSFRERKCSVFLHDQRLTERYHKAYAKDTAEQRDQEDC